MKKILLYAGLWLAAAVVFGQTNFKRAEELFMQNKPTEAVVYLESVIAEENAPVQAFLYLGIVYEQLDRLDEAIAVYLRIVGQAGDLTALAASNLGNVYFKKGDIKSADEAYTLALDADEAYAPAWLGRANTRLTIGFPRTAISDYERYLALESRSPKRGEIERLIAVIKSELTAEEQRRLIAEEAARAEAERKRRLLEEVSASLQSSTGANKGPSAGTEDSEGYTGEFVLE